MKKYLIINLAILVVAMIFSVMVGLYIVNNFEIIKDVDARSLDKEPPRIFNTQVAEVTATSALIKWTTDEEADSLVNYGLNKRYGMVRDPFYNKTEHSILLDDLMADTTYYFRVTSSDLDGNQSISSDFVFVTPAIETSQERVEEGSSPGRFDEEGDFENRYDEEGAFEDKYDEEGLYEYPQSEPVEQETITEILETIQQIQTERVLEIIEQQITTVAQELSEFEIIFDQVDLEVGSDYEIMKWKTSQPANSVVSMVLEEDFDANSPDPYFWDEGSYNESVTEHVVEITGLRPATTYHYKVSSETALGVGAVSEDMVFTTKSIKPEIYNISIYKIEEDAATILFNTNVPVTSVIEYTNLDSADTKLEGNSSYATIHQIRLTNLIYDTYYSAVIKVENEYGEKAQSAPFTFLTIKDEVAPIISKVNTESTLYPGADTKVQTIVSWETDELSKCQFFYHQGLAATDEVQELDIENDFKQDHVQVTTNLLPSTVYKFWIKCWDDVENEAKSRDFSMLTPTREESIIDIILKNFESTFGWVKNIGG
jgi:hypothetical protein